MQHDVNVRRAIPYIHKLVGGDLQLGRNGTGPLSVVPGLDLHGWRNPDPDAAQYFVMSLGGDKA
jgi:hypothetical protein